MGDGGAGLQTLTSGVGIADLSNRSRVGVVGADSAKLLNNLCTNDVLKLAAGQWCEAFLLNAKGGVLFYARLFKGADEFRIDAEPGLLANLVKHIDRYIIREKALVRPLDDATFLLHVCGGGAEALLKSALEVEALPGDHEHRPYAFQNETLNLARIERTPLTGFDLFGPAELKDELLQRVRTAAPNALLLTADDSDRLRVLAGLPAFGREVVEGCLAQEIDRNEQAISFTKGCYIGQETVARLDAMGHVNKVLRGLTISDRKRPVDGAKIRLGDKEVGVVSSSARNLDCQSVSCLAILRTAAANPGTEVIVDFAEGPPKAIVSMLPFAR